ncbi:MAG: hypothetical protein K1X67_01920 [Fimbriimonadaceae bacterium]|nr:hypothetical protein [Fimbriimonadaceae bacterium]
MLVTLLLCILAALGGGGVLWRLKRPLDPAERLGVGGLVGLGALGWITFFIGLVPGGIKIPALIWVIALLGVLAGWNYFTTGFKTDGKFKLSTGPWLLAPAALVLLMLLPVVNALAPSDSMDWDSLAYHLAVPKLWLEAGKMVYIPFIHHSNFPFTVDNLYIWGLQWGGQTGAKTFTIGFLVFGAMAVFGMARRWTGKTAAGWWAALAFVGVPVVLWESGSGYIDVAHGLFAGLGILYLAEAVTREDGSWGLAAVLFGLAAGSKYTGLQTIAASCFVCGTAVLMLRMGRPMLVRILAAGLVAVVIASPWYVRTAINTGNPVYPFFYEKLGGHDWDAWRASIYRDEQQTFGVGRTETGRNPAALPSAVVGLAFQPGRYINPGQTEGRGFPMGALGAAIILAALLGVGTCRLSRRDALVLGVVGVSLLMWFFLSQQSRYLTSLVVPLAVLSGVWTAVARPSRPRGANSQIQEGISEGGTQSRVPSGSGTADSESLNPVARPSRPRSANSQIEEGISEGGTQSRVPSGSHAAPFGNSASAGGTAAPRVLAIIIVLQAAYTFWLIKTAQTDRQLPVVMGRQSVDDYLKTGLSFHEPAKTLNEVAKGGKVALYDEVFGYLLDVPYFWANPGHSTRIRYEQLENGDEWSDEMLSQGFTHVYVNLQYFDRPGLDRFAEAAGLNGPARPYTDQERADLSSDLRNKWRTLIADAAAKGRLRIVKGFPSSIVWELRPK